MSKINILVLHETCDAVLFRQHTGIRRYATTRDWNVVTLRVGVDSEEGSPDKVNATMGRLNAT